MRKLILILYVAFAALFVGYLYMRYERTKEPAAPAAERTDKKAGSAEKKSSSVDDAIDYATGNMALKAYHSSKEKLGKMQETREKQMQDAMSGNE
jgi:hypothetical protein